MGRDVAGASRVTGWCLERGDTPKGWGRGHVVVRGKCSEGPVRADAVEKLRYAKNALENWNTVLAKSYLPNIVFIRALFRENILVIQPDWARR